MERHGIDVETKMKHVKGVVFQIVLCILGVDDEKPPRVRISINQSINALYSGIVHPYTGHFHKKGQITVKTWRSFFNPVATRYLCISIDICIPCDTYVL